ncbi:MAG: hypothetical protein NTV31_15805 [Bacteroidia bacterium]|nr:hypothetical protein [Bacteroidia bacterium]
MKKIVTLTVVLLISATVLGQVPASFKYQAVLRDARGNIKANTPVNILIDILQGSTTGNSVYSETHSVTTDSYGLINLELGNGIDTIGAMSSINWQTGTYFVKVTVDGVVMGTGQLLSVPYALYASKAANGFSGNYDDLINKPTLSNGTVTSVTGTVPVNVLTGTTTPVISMPQASGTTNGYLSSADWLTFNNKSSFSGSYTDLTNTPTTDGSETWINAGTNITVSGVGTEANKYEISVTAHTLSEEYGGGIVFFVYDGGQHGLIAAEVDLLGGQYGNDPDFPWFNIYCSAGCYYIESGATGDGLGAGIMNTSLIVATHASYTENHGLGFPVQDFAAKVCANYEVTITTTDGDITIGDWYLPSLYELNLLYLSNISTLNLYLDDYYWSSTEYDKSDAWYQDFSTGVQDHISYDGGSKHDKFARVRPIRAF